MLSSTKAIDGQQDNGLLQLTKTFRLCQELNNTGKLADWLSDAYTYLTMVNYPYSAEYMMPLPGHPMREVCKRIDGSEDGASIMEKGVGVYYNYTGDVDCFELDDDTHARDGWNWQACTAMGCWKDFGVLPRPKWITTQFGGHDIKTVLEIFGSNIIFSNGLLDPYSGGSVLISETVVAVLTEEGAHHIELRAATPEDPDWLVKQRLTESELIKGWISDYNLRKKTTFSM
ncbi:Lysosomal Pro-X carboxypeptidase [Euphorbia peplus]|nr:Lysosomal Pro-X carboxypeptidase [Euphorbia peplus]